MVYIDVLVQYIGALYVPLMYIGGMVHSDPHMEPGFGYGHGVK